MLIVSAVIIDKFRELLKSMGQAGLDASRTLIMVTTEDSYGIGKVPSRYFRSLSSNFNPLLMLVYLLLAFCVPSK